MSRPVDPTAVAGPAISVPATRRAVSPRRVRAVLALLAGLICLAGAAGTLGLATPDYDAVRRDGVRTTGTVAQLYPEMRGAPGLAVFRYVAGDVPEQGQLEVGSSVDDYAVGQVVTLYYDPAHPRRIAVDGVDDGLTGPIGIVLALLVAGLLLLVEGVRSLVRRRSVRRLLMSGPWVSVRVQVVDLGGDSEFTLPGGEVWRAGGDWPAYDTARWPVPGHGEVAVGQEAWWVRDGDRAVFSPDQGRPLRLAARQVPGPPVPSRWRRLLVRASSSPAPPAP